MTETKKILSILAHPDDESFGMGGTLAYYSSIGVEVYLICATRGELGDVEFDLLEGYNSVAELREAELTCAAEKLGIKEVIFLNYRDSGMKGSSGNQHPKALATQKTEKVAKDIVAIIRRIRPKVILTHDPVGGYHHPDHIAVHDATVMAFNESGADKYLQSGDPFKPGRLYYHIFPRSFIKTIVAILKFFRINVTQFGKNKDINLEVLAGDDDYPKHVTINYKDYMNVKEEASLCHASQLDLGNQSPSIIAWLRRIMSGKDSFMQAYPTVDDNFKESDLFYELQS